MDHQELGEGAMDGTYVPRHSRPERLEGTTGLGIEGKYLDDTSDELRIFDPEQTQGIRVERFRKKSHVRVVFCLIAIALIVMSIIGLWELRNG